MKGISRERLRALARRRPETIWMEVSRESGSLSELTEASIKEILEAQWIDAYLCGDATLRVPRIVGRRILDELSARRQRRAYRPSHRPAKSWRSRRFEETAVRQFQLLRRELRTTRSYYDAKQVAAEAIAPLFFVAPETLISWASHPNRRRRK